MAEKQAARLNAPLARARDNFFKIECFIVVLLLNDHQPVTVRSKAVCTSTYFNRNNRFVDYNYITNMLKVKEIVAKWGKFGKNVRISREKWLLKGENVLKVANSNQKSLWRMPQRMENFIKKVLTKSIRRTILRA